MDILNLIALILIIPTLTTPLYNLFRTRDPKAVLFGEKIFSLIGKIKSKETFLSKPSLSIFILDNKKIGILLSNKAILSLNNTPMVLEHEEAIKLKELLNSIL